MCTFFASTLEKLLISQLRWKSQSARLLCADMTEIRYHAGKSTRYLETTIPRGEGDFRREIHQVVAILR